MHVRYQVPECSGNEPRQYPTHTCCDRMRTWHGSSKDCATQSPPSPFFSSHWKGALQKKETWPLIKRDTQGYESTLRNKRSSNGAVTLLPNICKSRNKALHLVHACNKCEHGNHSKFHCPPTHFVCAMLMPSALNKRERETHLCSPASWSRSSGHISVASCESCSLLAVEQETFLEKLQWH